MGVTRAESVKSSQAARMSPGREESLVLNAARVITGSLWTGDLFS